MMLEYHNKQNKHSDVLSLLNMTLTNYLFNRDMQRECPAIKIIIGQSLQTTMIIIDERELFCSDSMLQSAPIFRYSMVSIVLRKLWL